MASVEMIGLLCAGSTRYHESGGHGSATDKLSRPELAGLLSGLDKASMNYALAKYALDQDAERMLIAHVRVWAAGVAVREDWHIVKGRPTVSNMAAWAVFEAVRPGRCHRCEGRCMVSNRVCSVCGGSGYKALSGRAIAEAIGMDEAAYRRLWKTRYFHCLSYVLEIESKLNKTLALSDRELVN